MNITLRELFRDMPADVVYRLENRTFKHKNAWETQYEAAERWQAELTLKRHTVYVTEGAGLDLHSLLPELRANAPVCLVVPAESRLCQALRAYLTDAGADDFGCQFISFHGVSADSLYLLLLKQINRITSETLQAILDINAGFSALSLRCCEIKEMIYYFKEVIGNPVAIYDETFNCIIATDAALESRGQIRSTSSNTYLNNVYFSRQSVALRGEDNKVREYSMLSLPISYEGKARAYLSVLESNRILTNFDYIVLDIAAIFIMTEMKHTFSIKSIEGSNIANFLLNIFDQKRSNKTKEDFYRQAQHFGLNPEAGYLVAVIEAVAEEPTFIMPRTLANVLEPTTEDEILTLVTKQMMRLRSPYLIGSMGETIIALCSIGASQEQTMSEVCKCCQSIRQELLRYYKKSVCHVGVGNAVKSLIEVEQSHQNAISALRYGKIVSGQEKDSFIVYEDNIILKLVSSIGRDAILNEVIPQSLNALYAYDQAHKTAFLPTLNAYFDANCNARAAAESLFIHYRTMLYRLNRISELFMIDLSDSNERMHLALAVKLLDLLVAGDTPDNG